MLKDCVGGLRVGKVQVISEIVLLKSGTVTIRYKDEVEKMFGPLHSNPL